jgi:hypothetical protein
MIMNNRNKRIAIAVGSAAAVVAIAIGVVFGTVGGSSANDAKGQAAITMTMDALWPEGYTTISNQTQKSDVIVYGEVVKIDPGRWNSPDGRDWTPKDEMTVKLIYTTFYVKPVEMMKGKPKWGDPIAFRVSGGTVPGDDLIRASDDFGSLEGLSVGDRVLVFGAELPGKYGDETSYTPDGYWLVAETYSAFLEHDDAFKALGGATSPSEKGSTLAQMKASIEAALSL